MIGAVISWFTGSRIGQWLILAGGAIMGTLVVVGLARRSGYKESEADQAERSLSNVEKANTAKRDADSANRAGAPDERVRKFYTD